MADTLFPKYSGVVCLVVMVTTLIGGAQGNDTPVISNLVVLNGGVVPEDAPKKTVVATFSSSDDGGTFFCTAEGSTYGVAIAGVGKNTVITNVELNYEDKKSYTVVVTCTDNGEPPLSTSVTFNLTVSNENDAPIFRFPVDGNDKATIYTQSSLAGQHVTVTAEDENTGDDGKLEYTFQGDQYPALFSIQTTADGKGKITIKKVPEATAAQSYKVTIRATDKGTPPKHVDSVPLTIMFTDASSGQVSYNNLFANLLLVSIINLLYFML